MKLSLEFEFWNTGVINDFMIDIYKKRMILTWFQHFSVLDHWI